MADYRSINLATESFNFATGNGKKVEIVITLDQSQSDYFGNGDWSNIRNGLNTNTKTYVDGQLLQSGIWMTTPNDLPKGFVAALGRVALTKEHADLYAAAMDRINNHPEKIAEKQKFEAACKADARYEAQEKAIDSMMTLNGNTY